MNKNLFAKLGEKDEIEFRLFVDTDKEVIAFINKAKLWHPVVRDEICKRLR